MQLKKTMKKNNWIYTSLIVLSIGFLISWILIGNWKIGFIIGVISGLITLVYNPTTRYMRAFWSVLSLLITMNSFSLNFVIDFFNKYFQGNVKTTIGNSSISLSIMLVILCIVLLVLDFFQRNKIKKPGKTKMTQSGGQNSTNYQSARDINFNTKDDKR